MVLVGDILRRTLLVAFAIQREGHSLLGVGKQCVWGQASMGTHDHTRMGVWERETLAFFFSSSQVFVGFPVGFSGSRNNKGHLHDC